MPRIKETVTNRFEPDIEYIQNLKSCHVCTHQPICIAFNLFKQSIEPNILDENTTLKAENLAKFCNLYQEKGLE